MSQISRPLVDMETVASTEAKNTFGQLLMEAQREPIAIERNGRAVAVLLSADRYQALDPEHAATA
jgi:antitoxin Phd